MGKCSSSQLGVLYVSVSLTYNASRSKFDSWAGETYILGGWRFTFFNTEYSLLGVIFLGTRYERFLAGVGQGCFFLVVNWGFCGYRGFGSLGRILDSNNGLQLRLCN